MKADIEYARDAIVGTIYRSEFRWYASEKELWVLDYVKWGKSFADAGYRTGRKDGNGYEDRFEIATVSEPQVGAFLDHLAPDRVDYSHLQALLHKCDLSDRDNFCHLMPVLFVNFDAKTLLSYFPEPIGFEKFVPDGWESAYKPFFNLIPRDERYWVIEGRDLLIGIGA